MTNNGMRTQSDALNYRMSFTNDSQFGNVTGTLPPLYQPLAIAGGVAGLLASICGQRLAPAGRYSTVHITIAI